MVPHNTYQLYWNTDAENTNAMHASSLLSAYIYGNYGTHTSSEMCLG